MCPSAVNPRQIHQQQIGILILNNFSGVVKEAVKTGVITGQARKEIIQVLRTYITKYTANPSSEQYVTICQKLVMKYPTLQETEGTSHFVSISSLCSYSYVKLLCRGLGGFL